MQMTIDSCINDGDFLVTQEQEQDKHVLGVGYSTPVYYYNTVQQSRGKKLGLFSENHKISIFLQIRIVVKGFHPLVVPSAGSYCHERQ